MREVVYHPRVPAEVRTFLDHYDAISSELGDSFWGELTEAIDYARITRTGIISTARVDAGAI